MPVDFRESLHVVSGAVAAGSLQQAYQLASDRLLVCHDPLAAGPVPATTKIERWESIRAQFWSVIGIDYGSVVNTENDLYANIARLRGGRPVVLWLATAIQEQLLAASLAYLYTELSLDHMNLFVVQAQRRKATKGRSKSIRNMGELGPEEIAADLPPPRQWTWADLHEYRTAWLTYTADNPGALRAFLHEPPDTAFLANAMRRLVYRYPAESTGLCAVDEEMLRQCKREGPRAARVIGHTIDQLADTEEYLGDSVLFHRLLKMGDHSLSAPLISIEGDRKRIAECTASVTEYGEQVLAGEANALTRNTTDDWIGGVHLIGGWPVPFRRGNELIIPN